MDLNKEVVSLKKLVSKLLEASKSQQKKIDDLTMDLEHTSYKIRELTNICNSYDEIDLKPIPKPIVEPVKSNDENIRYEGTIQSFIFFDKIEYNDKMMNRYYLKTSNEVEELIVTTPKTYDSKILVGKRVSYVKNKLYAKKLIIN
jgi:hypothetical protein